MKMQGNLAALFIQVYRCRLNENEDFSRLLIQIISLGT